jgi:hypothetical protein
MSLMLSHFQQLRHQRDHEHPATEPGKPTHRTGDQTDNHARKEPNHNRLLSANSFTPQVFCHPLAGNSGK